ncbi:MAG: murein biosynthesis integral membrane protein MurJ, partial [Anaerolineales bacterium]|nr:murein biosynthesis integral membrane protein MurJ [Anaerolineales bacterium]
MKLSHIARSSLIIAFFFAIDKVFGLARQVLFSRTFSPGELDIFLTSNNIPDLLSALISGGALGMALIPVMTEVLNREGRKEAWLLFSRILNLAFLITGLISLVIILFARPLVANVIAPGFEPAKQALTASLMQLDLLAILIFSLSGLVMAGLQANQHFLLPAMAPVLYNLGQILGVVFLASPGISIGPLHLPGMGLGVYGLVYGVIGGAALHLLIQVPGLLRYGFRWSPSLNLRHPAAIKVLMLMGPRVLSMLFLHIYFLARDNLASHFPAGAVTILNYGWFIQQMPETLIGTAIAIALLPSLSEYLTREQPGEFRDTVNRALRTMLALTLPAAALLGVAIQPLAQAVFGFQGADAILLGWVTRAFLLGLLGHTWLEVAVRSFFAQQDALRPLAGALGNLLLYLVLALTLPNWLGLGGLALADTLAFTSQALVLHWLLNRRYPGTLRLGSTLPRALGSAALG